MSSRNVHDHDHSAEQNAKQHGYSKVLLLGCVGRPPELRRTPRGIATGRFSLAIPEAASGMGQLGPVGQVGQAEHVEQLKVDDALVIEVVMFEQLAEEYCELLKAGSSIFVEGALSRRRWQTAGGVMKSRLEVVAQNIRIVG